MKRIGLLAAVVLLGLTACGDDKSAGTSETSAAPTTEPAATDSAQASDNTVGDTTLVDDTLSDDTAVDDTTVDDTTFATDPIDPNAPGVGSEFCAVNDELSQSDYDPFTATPAETEAYFSVEFPEAFSRLVASAPAELVADVTTLGTAYAQLTSTMEGNGWDFSAAYADPAVQELMNAPEIGAAGGNLDAYCGR